MKVSTVNVNDTSYCMLGVAAQMAAAEQPKSTTPSKVLRVPYTVGTVAELLQWMQENNIPTSADIDIDPYDGTFELSWKPE